MIEKLSNKERILEMLRDKELTVKDIAQELDLKENAVNVYICRLRNEKKIKKIGKIERYNVYTSIQVNPLDFIQLLRFLYEFMGDFMVLKEGITIPEQKVLSVKKIKELIV